MPRVLHRAPRWLDYGTPGFHFFQESSDRQASDAPAHDTASRRIAHRDNEVFYAVGKELRWSTIDILKEANEGGPPPYKVLVTPVPADRPIQQISISRDGSFVAVLTTHTCHVCILPPSESLDFSGQQSLKLKYFTVGETAHVRENSPLVSAIWHPLSPSGTGLVTITKDACVRLWELDQDNRISFSQPTVAVDLKKLANATSAKDDLGASKYGANKGYSADDVDMLVAGACFGGQGLEEEDGWSSMTLWVAMTEGDVYALCPFLPTDFWAPTTLLPSLTTSVVAKATFLAYDGDASDAEKRISRQQEAWLQELDEQDPVCPPGHYDFEVYSRPKKLSPIAKLQGPFQLSPEPLDGEITDIHVIAPKVNQEDLFEDEDFEDLAIGEGLSIGIVCLATSTNQVHVCLNVEGVEAEWLPAKRPRTFQLEEAISHNLLLFETIDLATKGGSAATYPTFTTSPADRYELFTTQPSGIYSLSFRPWIAILEDELAASGGSQGIGFRVDVILKSSTTLVEDITGDVNEPLEHANAAIVVLDDADAEYIALTSVASRPLAAVLDKPSSATHGFEPDNPFQSNPLLTPEARTPYIPSPVFFKASRLPAQIEEWRRASATGVDQGNIKGAVNFSPYTLQKITAAHQIVANETHDLNTAAADLFRRMERMLNEMKAQIDRVRDLSNRVNSVTGEDEFPQSQRPGDPELVRGGRNKIQKRVEQQREKTKEIQDRVERLRNKMRNVGGKEMSLKEKQFAEEVDRIQQTLLGKQQSNPTGPTGILDMENSSLTARTEEDEEQKSLEARFEDVQRVVKQLQAQAEQIQSEREKRDEEAAVADSRPTSRATSITQGADYRQRKMDHVWALLDRESALVDAVSARLEGLQMGTRDAML